MAGLACPCQVSLTQYEGWVIDVNLVSGKGFMAVEQVLPYHSLTLYNVSSVTDSPGKTVEGQAGD